MALGATPVAVPPRSAKEIDLARRCALISSADFVDALSGLAGAVEGAIRMVVAACFAAPFGTDFAKGATAVVDAAGQASTRLA